MKIYSRWNSKEVIFESEKEIIKTVVEEAVSNRANLRGANLNRANLNRANLSGADLYEADLSEANLREANLSGADLYGADLYGADLSEANLREANLYGADLRGADLYGAKGYSEHHEIFYELTRRETIETFTDREWSFIGIVSIHRICWDAIEKRFGVELLRVFEVLKNKGFDEYHNRYKEILKSNYKGT